MNCAKWSFCLGETRIWCLKNFIFDQNIQFLSSKNKSISRIRGPTECAGSAEPLKEAIRDSGICFRIRYDRPLNALVLIAFQAVIWHAVAPPCSTSSQGRAADWFPCGGRPPPARFFVEAIGGKQFFVFVEWGNFGNRDNAHIDIFTLMKEYHHSWPNRMLMS